MLSETLTAGLERYRIGPKVHALRRKKKLGLVQLGEHTGLSPAMLSKIERGQLFPTLPTLLRIALVFGVGLEHFFVDGEERPTVAVTRKRDRLRMPDRPGAGKTTERALHLALVQLSGEPRSGSRCRWGPQEAARSPAR